ncbi:helix-turn-helix transcriptional regulator [Mycobacterium sp.]|uniref:helix-turn-helix transcriptional regulator n=1 Tax=Mycobacterium sp. TaxID=1785 RepID=UPI0039C96F32
MDDHSDHGTGRVGATGRNRQRERVLELVREHDGAVDAAELAVQMGLHVTTVRFHLDALCSEGTVERTRITRAGVGRPRTGYLAVRERLDYRSLAEILALELGNTADKRRRRAEAAGRRWAERIAAGSARERGAGLDVSDSVGPRKTLEGQAAMVGAVFARMGFGPELTPAATSTAGSQQTIRLHACPVRDLARAHPEVGCALHRGLLQGLLASPASGGRSTASRPVMQAELEPFVEPDLCLARVIAHD